MKESDQELLNGYFQSRASDAQINELERRMLADPDLRQRYLQEAMTETSLRSIALQENALPSKYAEEKAAPPKHKKTFTRIVMAGSLAACLAVFFWIGKEEPSVGVILSSEMAGWQSEHSTVDGAEFSPGVYTLQSGVVTLGFHSGVEMVMEGPARIEVVSEMEIIFDYGNASFHVPEQAVGFEVNTRHGKVIDLGTRFSLSMGEGNSGARLSVEEGEIAVHHNRGAVKHLVTMERASMDENSIHMNLDWNKVKGAKISEQPVVLRTNGRERTVVRTGIHGLERTDLLMVKHVETRSHAQFDRRSLLAFDVSEIDFDQVAQARLILNSVPTGIGMGANDMPVVSHFGIYGIPDGEHESWPTTGELWEKAPKPEHGSLVAQFSIRRANLRQTVVLDSPELLAFLKADQSGEAGFIIHCETPGKSMVHGFASSRHREAAGPRLELVMKKP
ncbi:FecR domain-containing protein [Verrucomicrobiaceae bacterium 5K15]|uniref:FecR domain-containing protein n=1 Tax=Oceaniferula flava TaxID=2800421 RepID=A0AAE2SCC9_9BACT|nr:hypothetical protein [Oceaniferula flavus]MBK1855605.1 FecR domain-containing protein [Oceaniferula flavus]MBM1136911.1 FecR domain-containing protein [Oceaniferula flavus]